MKYPKVKSGEWVSPIRKGYKMMCCDCGLVHKLDFLTIPCGRGAKILFRAIRDELATSSARRARKT